ncbi:hypothetical protein QAD02_016240 [Eretmocerus hayati]|uniref:Uncharacterized protein n=1 Tax=Eretmocerus hayati TaxID=131215 RepID=A0ACC2PAI9_9HYME|nr:hypothetical protein QAD02_016240 [Eretmocerus hayati]
MVEEIIANNKSKNRAARPRPVYLWNVLDVQKWFRRHCSDYYQSYYEMFLCHDITGRALLRLNENILMRLGIENKEHRMDILREIMKLHLKTDILEIRDIERRNNMNYD